MALEAENTHRYTQYSREELGFLYSPSKYSKKQDPDVVEHHIQELEKCASKILINLIRRFFNSNSCS